MKYLAILFVAYSVISCGEYEPEVQFTEPIKGTEINLADRLGESFSVLRDGDTIAYGISYDPATSENVITTMGDTIFMGLAIKRRELVLLTRELKKGNFSIHALFITDSTITGLETEWYQDGILDSLMSTPDYQKLITDTTDHTAVEVNRRSGKHLFRDVIQFLPAEKIIQSTSVKESKLQGEPKLTTDTMSPDRTLIKSVHPNPFTDIIVVDMLSRGDYTLSFHTDHGTLIRSVDKSGQSFDVDLSDAPTGTVLLTAIKKGIATPAEAQQLRIIKL